MTTYSTDDIETLADTVLFVRRRARMFFPSDRPTGRDLASALLQTLPWLDALPVTISQIGSWWIISSENAWLENARHRDVFLNLIPLPESGPNNIRMEIMLTAFADAVVVVTAESMRDVKGCADQTDIPAIVRTRVSGAGCLLAFKLA